MTIPETHTNVQSLQQRGPHPQPAQQVSTINEQIAEAEAAIKDAEDQIENMLDLVRGLRKSVRSNTKKLEKLRAKRTVWLETAHKLQVLEG